MKVINVRGLKANDKSVFYCGRPCHGWRGSALANWHTLAPSVCKACEQDGRGLIVHQRGEAKEAFKRDLWRDIKANRLSVISALNYLAMNDIDLGCWCAPLACHCDVILNAITWYKENMK